MEILEGELAGWREGGVFDGETAFKLHDTYGFPLDLTADVCRERGVTVDDAGFDAAMARQKEQARAAGKFKMAARRWNTTAPATTFHGYEQLEVQGARCSRCTWTARRCSELNDGETGVVVLDDTPFYAEIGGQVGDRGVLAVGAWHLRGRRHAEDPGRRVRPPRRRRRPARSTVGDSVDRAGRRRGAPAHHAQPLGHPPDAQGAARSAGRPRAAEGLAGRCRAARASTSRTTRR